MTESTLGAQNYRIDVRTLNAFFWAWLKRNNVTKLKVYIGLALFALITIFTLQPILPGLLADYKKDASISPMIVFVGLVGPLMFLFLIIIMLFVVSPLLSYITQILSYFLGRLPKQVNSITINSQGISKTSGDKVHELNWTAIYEVVDTPSSIFLFTKRNCAIMIPKHAFPSQENAAEFAAAARIFWQTMVSK